MGALVLDNITIPSASNPSAAVNINETGENK